MMVMQIGQWQERGLKERNNAMKPDIDGQPFPERPRSLQ